jgi:hypothetical protein
VQPLRKPLLLGCFLLLGASRVWAEPPACRGTVSGAVKGGFDCEARMTTSEDGKFHFVLAAKDMIAGVPTYQPGSFELPGVPTVRTYTLDDLGVGIASVAREGGTLFTAAKTSSQRGEVTLELRNVKPDPGGRGTYVVHGTYRARLLPAGAGKRGEVIVEASF